jgi:hypothetical protein
MHKNALTIQGQFQRSTNINSGTITPNRINVSPCLRFEPELSSDDVVGLCCAMELPATFFDATDPGVHHPKALRVIPQ